MKVGKTLWLCTSVDRRPAIVARRIQRSGQTLPVADGLRQRSYLLREDDNPPSAVECNHICDQRAADEHTNRDRSRSSSTPEILKRVLVSRNGRAAERNRPTPNNVLRIAAPLN